MAVMERDFRLTGVFRDQSDNVEAPPGYEGGIQEICYNVLFTNKPLVNSRWKVGCIRHAPPDLILIDKQTEHRML
jgi:hypothetical protein